MHSVNGITLSSTELKALKKLVALRDNKAVSEFAKRDIEAHPKKVGSYMQLRELGLISGFKTWNGIEASEVNQPGIDFVRDIRKVRRREWFRTYLPSIISAVIGIGGTIGGVLLGWHLHTL